MGRWACGGFALTGELPRKRDARLPSDGSIQLRPLLLHPSHYSILHARNPNGSEWAARKPVCLH